jgi:PAS domain S-box-containing protein
VAIILWGSAAGEATLEFRMTIEQYDASHLARIVALAADAIICINPQQRITLFNNGAERTFGYSAAEVLGEPLDILIPERFRRSHDRHVSGFSNGPGASRHMGDRRAIFALRRTGEEFPAEATISKTGTAGDEVMTVILRDITAQAILRDELEQRVADRTQELELEIQQREQTQQQLVRAQRLEAFGQLTGGIAHDFNNLLTVIGGNLELLDERLNDDIQRKPLRRALDAVEMGARLTQRLLSFARRNRLEPEVLELNEEIVTVIDLLRRALGEAITISSVLGPQLWRVRADASQVENAIVNLAINARDAMPHGGRLIIETANATLDSSFPLTIQGDRVTPGDYVRVSISDTGTGMGPDVLARAFEPFFTTKEPGKGTGLGLASTYGFVRQSGGHVTIYSELGKGTTVNLYLPRSRSEAEAVIETDGAFEPHAAKSKHILVAEDHPGVRETTIERLERLGHRVTACDSGSAAIEILHGGADIDLVFSDVVMAGGISGFDLAEWIARNRPGMRVLLTSGFTDDLARAGATHAAMTPLLRKPYANAELAIAIDKAFEAG